MKLEVMDLSKTYGKGNSAVEALKGVSFTAEGGDVIGILGPNGAGKSTLNRILSTSLTKTSGEVYLDGISIEDHENYRKNISNVLQGSSLEFWLDVEDNLKIYGKFYGLKGLVLKERIGQVMELFDLNDFRKKRVADLSGGYRKRLQLAKSFMSQSPVMLLDEPTAGLDPISKRKVMDLLRNHLSSK